MAPAPSYGGRRERSNSVVVLSGALSSIGRFEQEHHRGPTLRELADYVGIPFEFGEHLHRLLLDEVSAGRVIAGGGLYRLARENRYGPIASVSATDAE